jgi:hypothetical protein
MAAISNITANSSGQIAHLVQTKVGDGPTLTRCDPSAIAVKVGVEFRIVDPLHFVDEMIHTPRASMGIERASPPQVRFVCVSRKHAIFLVSAPEKMRE